ncbi:hypothetical protein GW17_00027609 [Ensete ventricosum]|nr:hypothetical protein GW17_00027609 [Ensete ventricosum]
MWTARYRRYRRLGQFPPYYRSKSVDKMSPPPCLRRRGLGVVGDFSSFQVRGIANSKDSELMQGLVHGRRSVRGHPKVIQLTEAKLGSGHLSTGQEDAEAGTTQEWVDEGELPRE